MKKKIPKILGVLLILSLMLVAMPAPMVAGGDGTISITECGTGCYITPCENFGIKAEVHNTTGDIARDVTAWLTYSGPAEFVSEKSWELGDLDVGQMTTVAWTLHCEDPGPVYITVHTDINSVTDTCTVNQKYPPILDVEGTTPCEVCTNCDQDDFTIDADYENLGDVDACNVQVTLTVHDPDLVLLLDPPTKPVGTLTAHTTGSVSWNLTCLGPGTAYFTIEITGQDCCSGLTLPPDTDDVSVVQKDVIVTVPCVIGLDSLAIPEQYTDTDLEARYACDGSCPITGPPYGASDTVSRLQKFAVKANVLNCSDENMPMDVTLTLPNGTQLAPEKVHVYCEGTLTELWLDPTLTVNLTNVCACCDVDITWILQCIEDTGQDDVVVTARTPAGALLDSNFDSYNPDRCDPAYITQEAKAHLTTELGAYTFDCTGCETYGCKVNAVAVDQDFDVKITISNPGDADAEDITFDVRVQGPATCSGSYEDLVFPDVAGGKSVSGWLSDLAGIEPCECTGTGQITVTIEDLYGEDGNTCEEVLSENIDPVCPLIIKQIPFEVIIINPVTCTDIPVCTVFAVKAILINNSETVDLIDVDVELNWIGKAQLVDELLNTKIQTIDLIPKMSCEDPSEYEVTWMMECTGGGDVTFHVCAESDDPHLKVQDIDEDILNEGAWPIVIHQTAAEPADISVEIISPDTGAKYATSQEFAVTAVITNNEDYATVTINYAGLDIYPEGSVTEIEGELSPELPWVIEAGESKTVTWTTHCDQSGLSFIGAWVDGVGELCMEAYAESYPVLVWQYPAAHLVVEVMQVEPESPFVTSTEFYVTAMITNTGEADATEVYATLSVNPDGSVRVSVDDPEGTYTKYVGTIPGHGSTENYKLVTWNLHCKVPSESELTVTATGNDEYGWHIKQQSQTTGNFIIEYGALVSEELDSPYWYDGGLPPPNRGWSYGVFVGDANGLAPGPFIVDTDLSMAQWGGGPDYLGHIVGMGFVIPHMEYTGYFEYLIEEACGYTSGTLDLEGEDFMFWVVHIEMDSMYDMIGPWSEWCVEGGLIEVINGTIAGTYTKWNPMFGTWQDSLLGGTFHSNLAAEAGRAIPERFIEPDGFTVKQLEPAQLVVDISYPADGDQFTELDSFVVTATVSNIGEETAESAEVKLTVDANATVASVNPVVLDDIAGGEDVVATWSVDCDTAGFSVFTATATGTGEFSGNLTEALDTVTVKQGEVPDAQLVVDISYPENGDEFIEGDVFPVTATVTNIGETEADDVVVSITISGNASVDSGPTGTWPQDIGAGDAVIVSWTLSCDAAGFSVIEVGADGTNCNSAVDPVTVKQVMPPAPVDADLAVTKDVDYSTQTVGEEVTFTITVENLLGPADATGVRVTDLLPSGVNYVSSDPDQGWYDVTSGTWNVGDLAVGASVELDITVTVNMVDDISNIATITACDQPDPTTSNNADMAVVTGEAAPPVETVALAVGYNLISLPLIPEYPAIETILADLIAADAVAAVAYYTGGPTPPAVWLSYFGLGNPANTLAEMRDGKGYWMNMNTEETLSYDGYELVAPPPAVPPSYKLVEGWNLIGFKSTAPKPLAEYLAGIDGKYIILYGYANGSYFIAGTAGHEYLEPGLGYWIAMTESGTIYP